MRMSTTLWLTLALVLCAGGCGGDEQPAAGPDRAKVSEARGRCLTFYQMAVVWERGHNQAPRSLADLIPSEQEAEGAASRLDPWGHEYEVYLDSGVLRVRSPGPDGKAGTDDDIVHPLP